MDEIPKRLDRVIDFQTALMAGLRFSEVPDPIGQNFDKMRKGNQFGRTGLADVAANLMENIQRFSEQARVPLMVFNWGRRFQEFYTQKLNEQKPDPDNLNDEDLQFFYEFQTSFHRWVNEGYEVPTEIGNVTSFFHVAACAVLVAPSVTQQISGFSRNLVIQAWTVFESLAEDLWEAALNAHPTRLGALKGRSRSKFKRNARMAQGLADSPAESRVSVGFDQLQANSFNVRNKMGTILKKTAVSFRSLASIQEAYHRAFSKRAEAIDAVLDEPNLQFASAVRNVLIHKRGLVDDECVKQLAGVPDVPPLKVGDEFPLTGRLCAKLADACVARSVHLVMGVHQWISAHPESEE